MSRPDVEDPTRTGMLWAVAAFTGWGLSVLFWPLLEPASAFEILLHRIIWSFFFAAVILTALRGWKRMRGLQRRTWLLVATGGLLNAGNWGLFIYAVVSNQIVGASMAYFLNPLAIATLGVLFLRERMRMSQMVALGLGALAVVVVGFGSSSNPLLPVGMALCFGFYALVQRTIRLGPIETLTGESAILTPVAIAGLVVLQVVGASTLFEFGLGHAALFAIGGLVTLAPLIAFGIAARRVPLSLMAVMQYIAPIIQFLVGVFIAHEAMPAARWVGFALVMLAVVVFTAGQLGGRRGPAVAPAPE